MVGGACVRVPRLRLPKGTLATLHRVGRWSRVCIWYPCHATCPLEPFGLLPKRLLVRGLGLRTHGTSVLMVAKSPRILLAVWALRGYP